MMMFAEQQHVVEVFIEGESKVGGCTSVCLGCHRFCSLEAALSCSMKHAAFLWVAQPNKKIEP